MTTDRWRRALLRLLPPAIRDRFGSEWMETVGDLSANAMRHGGRVARWLYVGREVIDVVRVSLQHRNTSRRGALGPSRKGEPVAAALFDDVRWALRYTRRRPLFAATVGLTLAVSIAVATTAFGLATAVLWRPLPFADAERLAFVWEEVDRDGGPQPNRVTSSRYAAWRDTASGLASIAIFGGTDFTIDRGGNAGTVHGVRVSANYFDTLGVTPVLGRGFSAADETPGNHRVVVLSHAFWRDHLGSRESAIGEVLRLSGNPYTIIGVMPALTFPAWPVNPAIVTLEPDRRALWVPIARTPGLDQNGRAHVFGAIARLRPGTSAAEARERLNQSAVAGVDQHRARLVPMREQFVIDARTPLLALAGAALALLLIACANLAALYVSAFEARRAELTMRAALGAGGIRIARQLAVEAIVLAGAGAVAGMALARVALATIPGLLPPTIPFLTTPVLDLRVAGFAVALAALATLLLTGWPIARFLRAAPTSRGATSGPSDVVYRVLVIAEFAVTVALVSAAGLLGQSLRAVQSRDPGFALDRVFVADIGLPGQARDTPESVMRSQDELLAAIAGKPGIETVVAAYDHPLEANWSESPTLVGDGTDPDQPRQFELRIVSPGYFDALVSAVLD
jgi:predicted permease